MSIIDIVYNRLVFPLLSVSNFHHAYSSSGPIETVKEFTFHLVPTIDTLKCKVYVPIESIPSEKTDELLTNKSPFVPALLQVSMK